MNYELQRANITMKRNDIYTQPTRGQVITRTCMKMINIQSC